MTKGKALLIAICCLIVFVSSKGTKLKAHKTHESLKHQQEEDQACFDDPDCHRNVTSCIIPGCCGFKSCDENGECYIAMPMCVGPEVEIHEEIPEIQLKPLNTKPELDDAACFEDPECERNVTYCYSEGCCGEKFCVEGGLCAVAMPMCIGPIDEPIAIKPIDTKPELDDEACFNDPDCHRNVTSCIIPGCCGFKSCDENGECYIAMPMCIDPSVEIQEEIPEIQLDTKPELDDEACFNDPDCHRNVTSCIFPGCCGFKSCDENGECYVAMPMCVGPPVEVQEEIPEIQIRPLNTKPELDDAACFEDPECERNVTYCYFEGCCGEKFCLEGGLCAVAMPMCIDPKEIPQLELTEEGKRVCLNNDECHQEVTYCPTEDCCAYKECNSEGECNKRMSQCYKERYDDLKDEDCLWEENCYRNVRSCSYGNCCAFKSCENGECFVATPRCVAPELVLEPEVQVLEASTAEGSESSDASHEEHQSSCKHRYGNHGKHKKQPTFLGSHEN